jgi:hypothetical protein
VFLGFVLQIGANRQLKVLPVRDSRQCAGFVPCFLRALRLLRDFGEQSRPAAISGER